MDYEEFKRVVESPYWTSDPLRWVTPEKIGLAHFALDGKVGAFNLSWWLLDRREPPAVGVYRNTNILWVILTAPEVMVAGRSLVEHASFMRQAQFQQMLLECSKSLRQRVEKHGMTWGTLEMLARRKVLTP